MLLRGGLLFRRRFCAQAGQVMIVTAKGGEIGAVSNFDQTLILAIRSLFLRLFPIPVSSPFSRKLRVNHPPRPYVLNV